MQNNLENVKNDAGGWEKDDDNEFGDAEVIQLEVGQSIQGLLTSKFPFTGKKFGKENMGYIIKEKNKEKPTLIFGTAILNRKMEGKEIGQEIKIERTEDIETGNGTAKNFETYHRT